MGMCSGRVFAAQPFTRIPLKGGTGKRRNCKFWPFFAWIHATIRLFLALLKGAKNLRCDGCDGGSEPPPCEGCAVRGVRGLRASIRLLNGSGHRMAGAFQGEQPHTRNGVQRDPDGRGLFSSDRKEKEVAWTPARRKAHSSPGD